ncbi:hypothetical protein GCM10010272_60350 [Streptomyces lateritius]|nr:hypothetical protein GCM10010272_60350 [Streptomyces lateritius]
MCNGSDRVRDARSAPTYCGPYARPETGAYALLSPGVMQVLLDINEELYELARAHPAHTGAGTTAVGLLVTPHEITWFNVGDSRLYREDGGYLGQVSVDDSPSTPWEDCGEPVTATNIVLQTLGGADRFEPVHPHSGTDVYLPGTRWLLCSDGLPTWCTQPRWSRSSRTTPTTTSGP